MKCVDCAYFQREFEKPDSKSGDCKAPLPQWVDSDEYWLCNYILDASEEQNDEWCVAFKKKVEE